MNEVRNSSSQATRRRSAPARQQAPSSGNSARLSLSPTERGPQGLRNASSLSNAPSDVRSNPRRSRALTSLQGQIATRAAGPKTKAPDPKMVRKSANELYRAMSGWGTDEDRIFAALKDKTPEEIKAIKKEYKDHYGTDLKADLKSELSGSDLSKANKLMAAKHRDVDAQNLHAAMKGMGTDEAAIMKTLKGKKPEEIKQIKQAYRKRTGRSLDADLKSELSGTELDKAQALLKSDKAGSAVADLRDAMEGAGTDEQAVYKALEGKNAKERKAIAEAYKKKTGRSLDSALKSELSGADLTRARAALKGDTAAGDAARLDQAMSGLGTTEKEVYAVLKGKNAKQRAAIAAAYKKQTGQDLKADIKSEMSGVELERAESLRQNGKLTAAEEIRFATAGAGTDEAKIKEALQGKSKEQIEAIRADYKKRYGKNLDAVLASELSGREEFETKLALKGKPKNALEALKIQNQRYQYERGDSSNKIGRATVDLFSDSGKLLDRNNRRANEYAKKAMADGKMTAAEEKRLGQLVGFQSDDVKTYQDSKDAVVDGVATTATAVAAGVAIVASGGTAAPLATALLSSSSAAITRVSTTAVLSGKSYGGEQLVKDLTLGSVEGLAAGGGALAGAAVRKTVQKGIQGQVRRRIAGLTAEGVVDGAVDGAIAGTAEVALKDGTWDNGIAQGFVNVTSGGLQSSLATGASGLKAYPVDRAVSGLGKAGGWVSQTTGQVIERTAGRLARVVSRSH